MVTPHLEHEPDQESNMDSNLVEDLTSRLPTSELVKIIKGALECGRRNVPGEGSGIRGQGSGKPEGGPARVAGQSTREQGQ